MKIKLMMGQQLRFSSEWLRHWMGTSIAVFFAVFSVMGSIGIIGFAPAAMADNAISNPYPSLPYLNGNATVELIVRGASITLDIRGQEAPITAGNFVELVNNGFYDGLSFHRVVRSPRPFVVQGGDPQSANPRISLSQLGTGGYVDPYTGFERYIPLEILPEGAERPIYGRPLKRARVNADPVLSHQRGAVAMARAREFNSASSQFYITLATQGFLDGKYAVFGYVTDGMEVVDQIQVGDRITSAMVTSGLEKLILPVQD